ncbi:MAG: DNA mismatch repair protein MutS [Polyangiaceae bacterium]|nr:DNA mismatch repair protein MutS [Polyangiaceae bacterium]
MTTGLRAHYDKRAVELKQALAELEKKSDALSSRRGIVMLGIFASSGGVHFAKLPTWGWGIPAALVVVFGLLVVRHAIVASRRTLVEERQRYVQAGQRRLDGEPDLPDPSRAKLKDPDGARFLRADHPNASDLDIFGPGSLFVAVSRAETAVGEDTLARWLLDPAPVSVVVERQSAARELLQKADLLEDVSIYAKRAQSRGRAEEPLALWSEAPRELPVGPSTDPKLRKRAVLIFIARLLIPLTIGLFFARTHLAEIVRPLRYVWLAPFIGQLAILGALWGPIGRMVTFVSSREAPFGRFRAVFRRIEDAELESPSLAGMTAVVRGGNGQARASDEISKLERIIGFADVRHNTIIHIVLNLFFLYDVWVALALERWRARVGKRTRAWLVALGEIEALSSIATYAGEHPDFAWPEVDAGPARLEAKDLGHPLLSAATRINNDVSLSGPGRALLVTGSNMSGKSTYLRAMGLCTVMACAGMPVCARQARLSRLSTWTSMRIRDALDQGWSHFYAELLRLKAVVNASQSGTPVLFLLDEILHGTNSKERTIGARGVVLDLVRRGAIGAVSTHDYALVSIADESGGNVEPVHFSDHIEEGKMVFDYKLKQGVVQSTNAIRLMRAVGIDIEYGAE